MIGIAKEIETKEEIEKSLILEYKRLEEPIPSYKHYVEENEYRVYKFIPSKVWITDDVKDEKGNIIDHRTQLNINDLIKT